MTGTMPPDPEDPQADACTMPDELGALLTFVAVGLACAEVVMGSPHDSRRPPAPSRPVPHRLTAAITCSAFARRDVSA